MTYNYYRQCVRLKIVHVLPVATHTQPWLIPTQRCSALQLACIFCENHCTSMAFAALRKLLKWTLRMVRVRNPWKKKPPKKTGRSAKWKPRIFNSMLKLKLCYFNLLMRLTFICRVFEHLQPAIAHSSQVHNPSNIGPDRLNMTLSKKPFPLNSSKLVCQQIDRMGKKSRVTHTIGAHDSKRVIWWKFRLCQSHTVLFWSHRISILKFYMIRKEYNIQIFLLFTFKSTVRTLYICYYPSLLFSLFTMAFAR